MSMNFKRMGAFLIALAILCSLLPAGIFSIEAAAATQELTAADYAQADAVFAQIDAVAAAPALKNASQATKTEAAMQIVTASDGYVEGSLEQSGDCFTWWTDSGIRCMYNPRMIEIQQEQTPEKAVDAVINEPTEFKGSGPQGNQVYLIGPYYGSDANFTDQYKNEATRVAAAIGDTDGYTLYSGSAANIDNVATAVSNGAVVFFDSHGATDYQNPYNSNDYITGATCSYLCLTTSDGLTTRDYSDGAAYSDGTTYVNGAVIANHMTKDSPNGLLWMALCLGMGTDGLYAPLRFRGVEVVCGYSESVTFNGEYLFEDAFWSEMITGKTVAEASAAMKSKWGCWDWSVPIASYYGYTSGYYAGYATIQEARNDFAAFPIAVSDEDAWPGQRTSNTNYGSDSLQTVLSAYTITNVEPPCPHINNAFVPAQMPSCTQDGYTDGMYCYDCGTFYSGHNLVPGGHNYVDGYCTVCGQMGNVASGSCGENVNWTLDSTGLLQISGTGAMYDFSNGGAPWQSYTDQIKKLTIGNGVTAVGTGAFYSCTQLTEVTIPDSIALIGNDAFNECTGLTCVYMSDLESWCNIQFGNAYSNPLFYGEDLYCSGEQVTELVVPEGITAVNDFAFFGCTDLTKVVLPEGVASIGWSAFCYCRNMQSVTIPVSLTYVANYAFYDCSGLTDVYYNGTQAQWSNITIETDNGYLTDATLHCDRTNGGEYSIVTVDPSLYPESDHDYANNTDETKVFTYPGADKLALTFSSSTYTEPTYDLIYLYDGSGTQIAVFSGVEAAGKTVEIPGDTVQIRLYSDYSYTAYGYSFTSIVAYISAWTPVTVDASLYPESDHDYEDNTDETKTFTYPGAKKLVLTFSLYTNVENGYDYLYLYDGSGTQIAAYTGTAAARITVEVPGDTFKIRLVSDGSMTRYGYSFDSIVAYMDNTEPDLTGIAVNTLPDKTTYWVDESLDTTGLTLTATYSNGKTQTITEGFTVSGFNPNTTGTQILTVTYEEKTTTFTVTVFYGGACGDNLIWSLDDSGILTISGTGAMNSGTAPWYGICSSIKEVVIPNSMTAIGAGAFAGCDNLEKVYFNGTKAQWVSCGGSKELAGVPLVYTYPYQAKVNGVECNLEEAFANAKSGQTITLLVDCAVEEAYLRMGRTLDLNGCTLTVSGEFTAANSTAQIKDSTNGEGILAAQKQHAAFNIANAYLPVWVEGEGFHFVMHTITTRLRTAQTNPSENIAEQAVQFRFWLSGDARCFLAQALEDGGADNDVQVKVKMKWVNAAGTACEQYFTFREEEVIAYAAYNGANDNFGTHVFRLTVNGALSVQQLQMSAMLVCGDYKIELASALHSVT